MKTLYYLSGFKQPYLHWRDSDKGGNFNTVMMQTVGKGRCSEEKCWAASFPATGAADIYISESGDVHPNSRPAYQLPSNLRDPSRRFYRLQTSISFLQDGQVYSYRPAPQVDPPQRDYFPDNPPVLHSKILGEPRAFRVYLPRGYRQHVRRRYPVLYMHDGQNVLENGSFGSWQAHRALDRAIARGEIQEIILVAVDSGPNRFQDYVPPEDGGQADRYARFLAYELKPLIDRRYRTLRSYEHTCTLGSSLGGVVSLYLGWDFFHIFGRAGCLSGSWWLTRFRSRMLTQPKRPIKLYIDSGDSGLYNDGVHHTLELQKELSTTYQTGTELFTHIAHHHEHNEKYWARRLPLALRFLFPATEEKVQATLCNLSKAA